MSDTTRATRDKMKTYLPRQLTLNPSSRSVLSPCGTWCGRLDAITEDCKQCMFCAGMEADD